MEGAESSRKRSRNQSNSLEKRDQKVWKNDGHQPKRSTTRPPRRKKQKKMSKDCLKISTKKPLSGMTISVSTLSDNTKSKTDEDQTSSSSYNVVCRTCRELGADVIDLVCKRVTLLVCSEEAVKHATQRVRKAIKKKKPLVSVVWLDRCKNDGRRVDYEEYRLDSKARKSIQNREDRLQIAQAALNEDNIDALPASGWTEAQDLGCCCVCHENGTTADCPWCIDCPLNPNRISAK